MTHAFFKALLFLGAGSVIHALSGEQDIMKMGGLRNRIPWTHATFLIATLAIAGIPPLAGFFSKDEILWSALAGRGGSVWLWLMGVAAAGMTAFYMTRLYLLTFGGGSRVAHEAEHHLHESPPVMLWPLAILAVGSVLAGFVGVPEFLTGGSVTNHLEHWLAPVLSGGAAAGAAAGGAEGAAGVAEGVAGAAAHAAPLSEWGALVTALLVSVAGIAGAFALYRRGPLLEGANPIVRVVRDKYYVDELYDRIILGPYRALCRICAAFDERVVDGLVNATAFTADMTGEVMRLMQTGYVRNYALGFFAGAVVILYYVLR
jgi:NADH-quinone oxidoreductase subunit L